LNSNGYRKNSDRPTQTSNKRYNHNMKVAFILK
jgi:hypothetical protein